MSEEAKEDGILKLKLEEYEGRRILKEEREGIWCYVFVLFFWQRLRI